LLPSNDIAAIYHSDLDSVLAFLKKRAKHLCRVSIDDRRLSAALHCLWVDSSEAATLRSVVGLVTDYHPRLTVLSKNGILEIRPRASWTRAYALRLILRTLRLTFDDIIYIGDHSCPN
jgi:hypothetical protein